MSACQHAQDMLLDVKNLQMYCAIFNQLLQTHKNLFSATELKS